MEINFEKVGYTYNEKMPIKKVALKNLNLKLEKNKVNSIIGSNGSGKTTLIQMINALIMPSSGNIKVEDFEIKANSKVENMNDLRFNVGLIFQFPEEQIFNLTVREEIGFGLENFKHRLDNKEKHIEDALKMVGLDNSYLDKNPFTLSNGEMRKVAIASVLAYNPKVLIFDEPTLGLDPKSKNNLIKIIRFLKNRYNKTIVIVSHDMELVHKISDYVHVISNGSLVKSGTKYEIFTDFELLKKYNIKIPNVINFSKLVLNKKGKKIGYRDEINDLLKDIYRYAR